MVEPGAITSVVVSPNWVNTERSPVGSMESTTTAYGLSANVPAVLPAASLS